VRYSPARKHHHFGEPELPGATSAVRLTAVGEDVLVEHLVVDERQRSEPSADSPETTRALVELPDVRPLMLRGAGPLVLGERDVPALVEDVLKAQREAPIVLVSVDNSTREPLVNPQELARRLAGMARVVWLSTVAASHRMPSRGQRLRHQSLRC